VSIPSVSTWEPEWICRVNADPEFVLNSRWTDVSLRLASETHMHTYGLKAWS